MKMLSIVIALGSCRVVTGRNLIQLPYLRPSELLDKFFTNI